MSILESLTFSLISFDLKACLAWDYAKLYSWYSTSLYALVISFILELRAYNHIFSRGGKGGI